jgi:nucleoid-associated protein YgaU
MVFLAGILAGGGCGGDSGGLRAELDEPLYREAQQYEKEGRTDQALADYLKLIVRRGDQAPESHLGAGIIFLKERHDPIRAYYHFEEFLQMQPNSPNARRVMGLIEEAKREFAVTLPAHPLESEAPQSALETEAESLRQEVETLKAENEALRQGAAAGAVRGAPSNPGISFSVPPAATLQPDGPTPVEPDAPAPTPQAQPGGFAQNSTSASTNRSNGDAGYQRNADYDQRPNGEANQVPIAGANQRPTAGRENFYSNQQAEGLAGPEGASSTRPASATTRASSHPGRTHVVSKGDTLYGLAVKYYGSGARAKDILAANSDQLSSASGLKIGMVLKIP